MVGVSGDVPRDWQVAVSASEHCLTGEHASMVSIVLSAFDGKSRRGDQPILGCFRIIPKFSGP